MTMRSITDGVARLPILRNSLLARQFVKFGIVGVSNTLWDFGVYFLLTRGWLGFHLLPLLANGLAFLVSATNSYMINKRWTFRDRSSRHHVLFTKFLLVNIVALGLYETLFFLLHQRLHVYDFGTKLIAIAVVLVWNFGANRLWTFAPAENTERLQKQV